jgi:hypothetical protein
MVLGEESFDLSRMTVPYGGVGGDGTTAEGV